MDQIRVMLKVKGTVIWDYQGMKRRIPKAVLQNLVLLSEDLYKRPAVAGIHRIPKHALEITWDQTEVLKNSGKQLPNKSTN